MINLEGCGFSNLTVDATSKMYFITFYIFLPYYLTIGLAANVILVVAFMKQAKSENSFAYQLIVVSGKTFENLTFGLFMAGGYWFAGLGGDKPEWFTSNYYLMFLTMRITLPMHFFAMFLSLFVSVAMAGDRVFALWKPFLYKNANHKRNRNAVIAVCAILALGLCVDYYFYYDIRKDDNSTVYVLGTNKNYVGSTTAIVLESIRTPLRIGTVIVLIVLNVAMVVIYNRRMNKLDKIAMNSKEKAEARKDANKELLILSVCQSLLTCLDQIPHAVLQVIRKQSDFWAKCGLVMAPVSNGAIMVSDAAEVFIVILVNRKMRESMAKFKLWKALCGRCSHKDQVSPMRPMAKDTASNQQVSTHPLSKNQISVYPLSTTH